MKKCDQEKACILEIIPMSTSSNYYKMKLNIKIQMLLGKKKPTTISNFANCVILLYIITPIAVMSLNLEEYIIFIHHLLLSLQLAAHVTLTVPDITPISMHRVLLGCHKSLIIYSTFAHLYLELAPSHPIFQAYSSKIASPSLNFQSF